MEWLGDVPDEFTPIFGDRRGTDDPVDSPESPSPVNEGNPKGGPTSLMLDPSVFFRPHDDVVASGRRFART
jgi:hypothetical protein